MTKKGAKKVKKLTTPKKTSNLSLIIGIVFIVILVVILVSIVDQQKIAKTGLVFYNSDCDGKCDKCTESCMKISSNPDQYDCKPNGKTICDRTWPASDLCCEPWQFCLSGYLSKSCANRCTGGILCKDYHSQAECVRDSACTWNSD